MSPRLQARPSFALFANIGQPGQNQRKHGRIKLVPLPMAANKRWRLVQGRTMNGRNGETLVVALGGNAIKQAGERGTSAEQFANVTRAAEAIAALVEGGDRVVITHGNGPQVGSLLLQQAAATAAVPPLPMDVCGAMTQGWIG